MKYHTLFFSKLMKDVAKFVVCCSQGLNFCFRIKDVEGESIDLVAEEGKTKKKIKDINMKKYKNLQEYLSNTKVHLPKF